MSFFRIKVFRKVFFMYSAIIVAALLGLSAFVTTNIKKTMKNNQVYLNQKIIENVHNYFKVQYETSKVLTDAIYTKPMERRDILNFLNNNYEDYIKLRLDNYYLSELSVFVGIDTFVRNCFSSNSNIENVIFYSNKNDTFAVYDHLGTVGYIYDVGKRINLEGMEEKSNRNFSNMLNSISSKDGQGCYYTINSINDPYKLENIGSLIIRYKLDAIDNMVKSYAKAKSNVVVINKDGEVIYDSLKVYTRKVYPYLDKLKTTDKSIMLKENSYIDIATGGVGVTVVGILPVANVFEGSRIIVSTIYILALLLIFIAEFIIILKIDGLSKRTENIMKAMKELQKGNFKVSIPNSFEDDELNMISESFNNMCKTLDDYINKVYVAEIKQKNAEVVALQSQINPHFLYNTLESIRMKAISNGDKEIGKMLYNVATLFRNIIKGKSLITIGQELEHCRLYLDLFKFRYEGKFEYYIDIEPDLITKEIIKFTLQPIIENYIVHGVRLENDDNFLLITVEKEKEHIIISLEDNGKGIEEEKLKEIEENLKNYDITRENIKSIGILNVHERLVLTYGKDCGITIKSKGSRGTTVIIKIPNREAQGNV
ncbi:sensor histidine kinase [Desnuesiella massiliensis]|uniref:sensor histidine kinase n=1 Tax=Desnuesiella massiliensis TaxID=1650662 RepID=UPI0006E2A312|nr:sensor histidine kinase [Desnuesiella massiliensis]